MNRQTLSALALFMSAATPAIAAQPGITSFPVMPKRQLAGDIVGMLLRNGQTTTQSAGYITMGQTFRAGDVAHGSGLVATIAGVAVPVQVDAKSAYPDGSVKMAVLTMQSPSLPVAASDDVMLSLGQPLSGSPISLGSIPGWTLAVDLTVHGTSDTPYHFDVAALLAQAEANGTASSWLSGPLISQARIDVPVTSSMHLTFDVSRLADGSVRTDVEFNNDYTMQAVGGTLNYDATITQNGAVVFSQTAINHFQYQTWHTTVATVAPPAVNVVPNVAYMQRAGAFLNYDLSSGIQTAVIQADTALMTGPGFGILGNDGITQYMPETGGRGDIGPQTEANTIWLMTGDPSAASFALSQAEGSGSVPWHFFNPTTGHILTTTDYPGLWADPRGSMTQQVDPNTGWTVDFAHVPDLAYIPYLMTGSRYYLDQLNAEANGTVLYCWPQPRTVVINGVTVDDIVAQPGQQQRGSAWSLREETEAAYANPDGTFEKTYFTQVLSDNFTWLLATFPTWQAAEGQAYGWIPSIFATSLSPWQQDYFSSTIALAAEQGNAQAVQVMHWTHNFNTQRFLNPAMDPYDGANYTWILPGVEDSDGIVSMSWASVEQTQIANNNSNGSGWLLSAGDYAQDALQSLADEITTMHDADAVRAYTWLLAYGPQSDIGGTANVTIPQFNVVPRLADGKLLTGRRTYVVNDTTANTVQGGAFDQMIADIGTGNDVLMGGSHINILAAGSGNDTLIGGPGDDYLLAGAGQDVLSPSTGTNYMAAGAGADTFSLYVSDKAVDTIADFKLGTDHLYVVGRNSHPLDAAKQATLISTATSDAAGDSILHLSLGHSVTLLGIATTQLTTAIFTTTESATRGSKKVTAVSSLFGWGTANTAGNVNMLPVAGQ